jgi:hypothetical protein
MGKGEMGKGEMGIGSQFNWCRDDFELINTLVPTNP